MGKKIRLPATIGLCGALLTLTLPAHSDWSQVHAAARALLAGDDPYTSITHDGYPLYYPLTAVILALPLAWLPLYSAQAAWAGLGTAAFSYALLERGRWALLALASAPFLNALLLGQWSPLLVGATAVPWLGAAWACKPTLGLAFFAAYPSRRALASIAALGLVSLVLFPAWPARWLAAIDAAPHIRPLVTRPGGVLLLLALVRWRRPEARLLAALACVPQNMMPYEMLAVFLVPRTLREMGLLVMLSQLAFALAFTIAPDTTYGVLPDTLTAQWPIWLALIYLPALLMVLRPQPAPVPAHA